MITHFYSDPHFAHANIIKHADRPFADVGEMHRELFSRYHASVGIHDTVLWLGDCSWDMGALRAILRYLPGNKGLVLGNHDKSASYMAKLGFDFVVPHMLHLDLGGVPAIACHYPPKNAQYADSKRHKGTHVDRRPTPPKGTICVHGHTHEKTKALNGQHRIHVGVDAWDFAPAPMDEVVELARGLVL